MFPLTSIFLTTLESHNLFVELPIRIECAAEYGLEIESRYQAKNPYHNAVHAASVVWDINFFLRHLQQPVTSLQIFSALVAGAVHDVNHPGMNNAYLVNTNSPLAIKYSDDSVLERMHLAEAFQAATKEGCDIFEGFPKDVKRQSRQQIIKMVLATDLSDHLKHVNRLKSKRYAVHPTSSSDLMATPPSAPSVPILPDDLVFHSIIMMADLGHAMKSFDAHFAWSKLVTEEFFRQGDTERQFGMPISPLCDRFNCKFEKNQIGFLDFVVLPLYSAVSEVLVFEGFDSMLARIQHNTAVWRQKVEHQTTTTTDSFASEPPHPQPSDGAAAAASETNSRDADSDEVDKSGPWVTTDSSRSNSSQAEEQQLPQVITVVTYKQTQGH
uniref:PDEase domain-containing protein n=1 Tax=Globisporangium ultimum (strain ATCC 200006 / CBS 805.95 / DAOM BR144) TaxID=431595 RepID=K3WII6_GLOUD